MNNIIIYINRKESTTQYSPLTRKIDLRDREER